MLNKAIMSSSNAKNDNFRKKGRKREPVGGRSELGELLATLRTERDWTLLQASSETGISHRIIAKLEKGQLDTSITNLEKYLRFFGFTLSAKRIEDLSTATDQPSVTLDDKGLPQW